MNREIINSRARTWFKGILERFVVPKCREVLQYDWGLETQPHSSPDDQPTFDPFSSLLPIVC